MKILKKFLVIVSVIICFVNICQIDKYIMEVNAASNLVFDYSEIEKNPYHQFYYSDEEEFFIDGIKVLYNGEDVTEKAEFIFYTTPKTTYDGKNINYIVPVIAEYDGKASEGQLEVKIGKRGDVNCDHEITSNDLILVQNDLLQTHHTSKTSLTAYDGFGIFLGNADGRQFEKVSGVYKNNMFNIGDAFFISSYLNGKGKGSIYKNLLLNNAIKPRNGEIHISDVSKKAGDIISIPVTLSADTSIGAFDFTCVSDDKSLVPIGVISSGEDITVFSTIKNDKIRVWGFGKKDAVPSGEIAYLQYKIPYNASKNTKYDISISRIDYFGTGTNISDYVLAYDGTVTVSGKSTVSASIPETDEISYDYGIRVWDEVVEYGTTSVELPIILLGSLELQGLTMTVQCDTPLSISGLDKAVSVSSNGNGEITGIYDNHNNLQVDFETLKVSIDKNAKAGTYPVNITVKDLGGTDKDKNITLFNGSVTIKAEPFLNGDANSDGKLNVRDCAFIASKLSLGKVDNLPEHTDFNMDHKINVRDAAAIAKNLSEN